ncbi:PspA/IM30 family protein [Orenia marismortui]|uniref:Phage shock protein A (PspA) family protein n=1 Tax=Orenia marismortui TaxID=46469 RepID=A0A4R8GYR9_9FIRM|nr:PspA/IM30 family protein [Orenia marismortui]TDX51538.1 phage shock protein A (PspA) family protein [Orenia marismortui]
MGLFDRIKTIVSGKANEAVDKWEDKNIEVVVKEEIRKMKDEYRQAKSAVNKSITLVKEVEAKRDDAKEEMEHWTNRAKQALEASKEDLARKALEKKQTAETNYNKYKEQAKARRKTADLHKKKLEDLRARIEEAEDKQDQLIAEAENAKATTEINETLSGLGKSSAAEDLDRLSSKVDKMKARAEASNELYDEIEKDDLESEFEELNKSGSVDDELAKLKAEIDKK